ncbi:MAG: carboxypeptidase-like regulatory domain-containing protein [Tannerella sp.]|nr:carboxypeptidase-like regulatory domain-containing protein [Tannerella sp.]
MKFLAVIHLLVLCSLSAFSQAKISGRVSEAVNNESIGSATVILLQPVDSLIVAYATTDENGLYTISTRQKGKLILKASFLGYEPTEKEIFIGDEREMTENFQLLENALLLDEVVVKAQKTGIRFGQDTIIYDAAHFRDGTEQSLGELLNKMPGIEVDKDGRVKAQGKDVEKIMLNGQDFFQGSTQMATKNLSADVAENVQVLSNYSEYSLLSGFQSHEQTVINVGVDKKWLGRLNGDFSLSGGVREKYEAKENLMRIGEKSMIAILGSQNDTGEEIFSMEDYIRLQGGVKELIGNNKSAQLELSEEEQNLLVPSNDVFARNSQLYAANYSAQPHKSFKLNSYVIYNQNIANAASQNNYSYNLPGNNPFRMQEAVLNSSKNSFFNFLLKTNCQISETSSLFYKSIFSNSAFHSKDDISNGALSKDSPIVDDRRTETLRTQQNIGWMKTFGKHLFIAEGNFAYVESPAVYQNVADTLLLPLSKANNANIFQNSRESKTSAQVAGSTLFRINDEHIFRLVAGSKFENSKFLSSIENHNYNNDIGLRMLNHYLSADWLKNKGLVQFKLGVSANTFSFKEEKNSEQIFRLLPFAEFSLNFNKRHRFSAELSTNISANSVKNFTDYLIVNSYNSFNYNNADIGKYNLETRITAIYTFFEIFSNTMLAAYGNYSRQSRQVALNTEQDGVLSKINYLPSPDIENLFANISLDKGLGFIPVTLKIKLNHLLSDRYSYISSVENEIITHRTGLFLGFDSKFKSPLNTEIYAKIDFENIKPTLNNPVKQRVERYGAKLKWNVNPKIYAETAFEYNENRFFNSTHKQYILNCLLQYAVNKNINVFLEGQNILNLNNTSWTTMSYSNNYTLERTYGQIPGFALVGVNLKL